VERDHNHRDARYAHIGQRSRNEASVAELADRLVVGSWHLALLISPSHRRGSERDFESVKLNGLDPQHYLADALARIADHLAPHIAEL
jgi:hypothetical protein